MRNPNLMESEFTADLGLDRARILFMQYMRGKYDE